MKKTLLSVSLLACASVVSAAPLFTLNSADFSDNAVMAKTFAGKAAGNASCTGDGISPALGWSNPPQGTKSFALTVVDPQGAKGLGVDHLVAYNIPLQRSSFARGEMSEGQGYTGGKNTPGTLRYYGPCPPVGSGEHHYIFTLIATDLPENALEQGLTREALLGKLKGHALGAASLIGRFGND